MPLHIPARIRIDAAPALQSPDPALGVNQYGARSVVFPPGATERRLRLSVSGRRRASLQFKTRTGEDASTWHPEALALLKPSINATISVCP